MMEHPHLSQGVVHLVDDDPGVVDSLSTLLTIHGFAVHIHESSRQFVEAPLDVRPACAVVDLKMPGLNGIEVQQALHRRGVSIPLIFISAHGDVESAVTAMHQGAVDFLTKPLETDRLLSGIRNSLEADSQSQSASIGREELEERLNRLTPREREVFDLLVAGMNVKQIGLKMGISSRTAEKHRDRVLKKIEVPSPVGLVHVAVSLKLTIAGNLKREGAS